jgi:uncharacterized OsmC-like protein
VGDVVGEVEKEDGVLVIRRIHVAYRIIAEAEHAETIERVHIMHALKCPVYRTLCNCVDITTSWERADG